MAIDLSCGYAPPPQPLRLAADSSPTRWNRCFRAAAWFLEARGASPYWTYQGAIDWAQWMTFGVWSERLPALGITKEGGC